MPPIKQRQDKKNHSIQSSGVLLSLLSAPEWRDEIRALQVGDAISVRAESAQGKHDSASRLVRRYRLAYTFTRVADGPDTERGASLFRLAARDHPSVMAFAEEYPEAIGVEASWDPRTKKLLQSTRNSQAELS